MFAGEQPGDMEDRQGRPFVGPAGRILEKYSPKRAYSVKRFTSRMPSNTSSLYSEASGACTKNR